MPTSIDHRSERVLAVTLLLLAGALPAAGLALISELSFELWERTLRRRRQHRGS